MSSKINLSYLKKNYILVGEAGSGKTELAINLAIYLCNQKEKDVCFFDMDQTKGFFRARNCQKQLETSGVKFYDTVQFMDAPIIPPGVTGAIADKNAVCVFDIGGDTIGSRMIGQFKKYFNNDETDVFYVINPYRPFSGSLEDITENMENILIAAQLFNRKDVKIIANPCMGHDTTVSQITAGYKNLKKQLDKINQSIWAVTVKKNMLEALEIKLDASVIPINTYIEYK